jgi:hypothetical protein
VAYRINPKGGIVQIRTNPLSIYSTFKFQGYVPWLLKTRKVRIIRLNNGRRMVVRAESFDKNTIEPYNEKATKLLHETWQKTAIVYGPVIVINPEDWST